MEYHSNKDQSVAVRIFELGCKTFAEAPDYVVRYVQFLLSVNDENSELNAHPT
jgi:cleavage stimulation factor subunit 3